MKIKSISAAHAASRIVTASALALTLIGCGALYGCGSATTNTGTTNANTNVNVNSNSNSNANGNTNSGGTANANTIVNGDTTTTGGEAGEVFSNTCSLKGNVIGAQHIVQGTTDMFSISTLIEPDLPDEIQPQANQSTWQICLYFVAKDSNGNYLGSWASDTISYDWTYGKRIDDTTKHITAGGSTSCQMAAAKRVEVYLTWAKGTFPDGSIIEYKNQDNANIPSTQAGAEQVAAEDQLFGSVKVDQAVL